MTTPKDAIEATAYRILRSTFVALISNRDPARLTDNDKTAIIASKQRQFDVAFAAICECLKQSRAEAIGTYRQALHAAEGVDHEMLDEAAEYGLRKVEETKA